MQIIGMMGLMMTLVRTSGWTMRLMCGRIQRHSYSPVREIPMRSISAAPENQDTTVTPIHIQSPSVRHSVPRREMAGR